jgi:hypothetical protein
VHRAFALFATLWLSCASSAPIDYGSPQHPKVGCFAPKASDSGRHEGKLLPEVIISIGLTPIDDSERVKVLRAPDFAPEKWEPHPKEEIVFGGRCRAGADLQQMFDASRGAGAAPIPPNQ